MRRGALTIAALGVVFGDIGTSPLYALQAVFAIDGGAVKPTKSDVYGVVSLVFWSITVIVSVKYVTFVMRADNEGEGGIMALTALVRRLRPQHAALPVLGVIGAALFYGDGMITPAISVLSAVQGVEVTAPGLSDLVVPITIAILAGLFAIQQWGTYRVGGLFGPVMLIWFVVLAAVGIAEIGRHPDILKGLSPTYAVTFWADHVGTAFIAMGAIVLAVTGAEALYADMGHFGRPPIRRAWFAIAFPALTLNYLGQAGLVLHDPRTADNPFFHLVPDWAQMPMVALSALATVIASQAVISGAFSITKQAIRLGYLPRLTVRHTSEREVGQVYVPFVNWTLFVFVVAIVLGFGSSSALASAYGVAVTGTFMITTILYIAVTGSRWAAAFLVLELLFFAANLTKIVHGGWLPLVVAAAASTVMLTWSQGRAMVTRLRHEEEGPLQAFIDELHEDDSRIVRRPGTAVFPNPSIETTPLALRANVQHNRVLHESVVIVSAESLDVPYLPDAERIKIDDLGYGDDGIAHVTARFGFHEEPNLPNALKLALERGLECELDVARASYFVSRLTITVTGAPGMSRWRKRLFVTLARNAASPVDYFGLPVDRTVTMGSAIEF